MHRPYSVLAVLTLLAILLLAPVGTSLATPPIRPDDVIWSHELGGPGDENGFAVIRTIGGGYAVAGSINSTDQGQGFLEKTDEHGYPVWNRTYTSGQDAEFYDLRETYDGGFILAGFTIPNEASVGFIPDGFAVKTDVGGNQQWAKTFGEEGRSDLFYAVEKTDKGFVFTGRTSDTSGMKAYVVKTDLTGGTTLESGYGAEGYDIESYDVKNNLGYGYLLTGREELQASGQSRPYVAMISDQGELLWQRTLASGNDSSLESMAFTSFGYVVAGTVDQGKANGSYNFYLARLDLNGSVLWTRSYGGPEEERAKCVIATPDGGYLLVGVRGAQDRNTSAYVVKTDSDGNLEWEKSFGEEGRDLRLFSAVIAPDGSYVLAGYASTPANSDDVWLLMLRGEQGTVDYETGPTPTAPDDRLCCVPMLVLPLVLVSTAFAARRR